MRWTFSTSKADLRRPLRKVASFRARAPVLDGPGSARGDGPGFEDLTQVVARVQQRRIVLAGGRVQAFQAKKDRRLRLARLSASKAKDLGMSRRLDPLGIEIQLLEQLLSLSHAR